MASSRCRSLLCPRLLLLATLGLFFSGCWPHAPETPRHGLPGADPHLAIPRFADAAERLGIRFSYDNGSSGHYYYPEVLGGGGALFDYDGDGWLDVFLAQGASLPGYHRKADLRNRLFHNRRGYGFEDVTDSAGVAGVVAAR